MVQVPLMKMYSELWVLPYLKVTLSLPIRGDRANVYGDPAKEESLPTSKFKIKGSAQLPQCRQNLRIWGKCIQLATEQKAGQHAFKGQTHARFDRNVLGKARLKIIWVILDLKTTFETVPYMKVEKSLN